MKRFLDSADDDTPNSLYTVLFEDTVGVLIVATVWCYFCATIAWINRMPGWMVAFDIVDGLDT